MPAYLGDIHASLVAERIAERDMVNLLEKLLNVLQRAEARQILPELSIDPRRMFWGGESRRQTAQGQENYVGLGSRLWKP